MSSAFTRYLPSVPGAEPWGIAVTAGGASRTPRGAAYPPGRHPADHHLTWDHGRVLGAWQIVLIARGRGRFESAATGLQPLAAGTALILFPGTWHRYAPDPATGWDELWIELQGPTLARLCATGVLAPASAVVPLRTPTALARHLRAIHARLRRPTTGFDAVSAGLALQALGLLHETARPAPANTPIDRAIATAEQALAADLGAPCPIPGLAARLGFAESYFRRAFKTRTGLAPLDYRRRLRLDRARRLLGTTNLTLEVIAENLGFSSAFHLSTAFKRAFGQSPRAWRQTHPVTR